jgi:superoxide dismutase, Fe-Mn family
MSHTLPELPYVHNELEPHFDTKTMEIHHGKHHQAYVTNLNNAIVGTEFETMSIEDMMSNISKAPMPIRNNGGGHWNHSFFWSILSPNGGGEPQEGRFMDKLIKTFGTYADFKTQFAAAGTTRFGSGWAWLCVADDDSLFIASSPNQDNPLMDIAEKKGIPILGLDVWEHAYYLHYQNRRPDYIAAFWSVVNWSEVSRRYNVAVRTN